MLLSFWKFAVIHLDLAIFFPSQFLLERYYIPTSPCLSTPPHHSLPSSFITFLYSSQCYKKVWCDALIPLTFSPHADAETVQWSYSSLNGVWVLHEGWLTFHNTIHQGETMSHLSHHLFSSYLFITKSLSLLLIKLYYTLFNRYLSRNGCSNVSHCILPPLRRACDTRQGTRSHPLSI